MLHSGSEAAGFYCCTEVISLHRGSGAGRLVLLYCGKFASSGNDTGVWMLLGASLRPSDQTGLSLSQGCRA
ncbi:hypothetical protein EIM92_00910 [Paenibacillus lentus]|uniref:Uncharacterized protein n=1 Tax=Paenibacillus lentus TaxID=1338368 RepID=A0A3S8RPZ3_9BACL|nr:hypothetical protein EIM92_00910 [Paenibacillus lentus]